MTVKTNHGAFAMIANTKEGWYAIGSTDGPSHRYNREFWDAVFGEGITSIGKANQDSKEDNIYRINESSMRWCYYTITLFGDPSLEFYEATSQPILHIKDISGGFGIESAIENTGDQNANSVSWSVSVKGGRFGFVNKSFTGDFELLEVGDNETIKTRSFFGFGRIDIIITANLPGEYPIRRVEKDKWFLFGCYVLQTSDRLKQLFERKFFER